MATEHRSDRFQDLDRWPDLDILSALAEAQFVAVAAVQAALPALAVAAQAAVIRLKAGGRLVYVGAGTSGRLGVLDSAELTPTFNWPPEKALGLIAGGDGALRRAIENAEDSREDGVSQIRQIALTVDDVVIGISASGTTPFTVASLEEAQAIGALTIGIASNPDTPLLTRCAHPILLATGHEAIAGSTRLKAGTAQKIALNLFSTLTMVRMGRIYRGLMVDMRTTNAKLRRRGEAMVAQIAGCDLELAALALQRAQGDVKVAALVVFGLDPQGARTLLDETAGDLRAALAEIAD